MFSITEWFAAAGELANERGLALAVLLAPVLAVGPMYLLFASPDLFAQLSLAKVLLVSLGITLVPVLMISAPLITTPSAKPLAWRVRTAILCGASLVSGYGWLLVLLAAAGKPKDALSVYAVLTVLFAIASFGVGWWEEKRGSRERSGGEPSP